MQGAQFLFGKGCYLWEALKGLEEMCFEDAHTEINSSRHKA